MYEALLANLGVKGVEVSSTTVKQYEKLLVGGIWSIITLQYFHEEGQKGSPSCSTISPSRCPTWTWKSCLRTPRLHGSAVD